jgi:hypothetical protein
MPHADRSTHLGPRVLALACAAALGGACTRPAPGLREGVASAVPAPEVTAELPDVTAAPQTIDARMEVDLLAIADAYKWMTNADGTWWAPADCQAPTHPAFASKAENGPHGRKLYTLFIKDYPSYTALSGSKLEPAAHALAAGSLATLASMPQVIVKEAWTPVPSAEFRERCGSPAIPNSLRQIIMDGAAYRACEPAGLFVMYRPPPGTEGTDGGWLYGTVQYVSRLDLKGSTSLVPRVTAAGRVASCMGCHVKAPHGRLFGLAAGK